MNTQSTNRHAAVVLLLVLSISLIFNILYFPTEVWYRADELPTENIMTLHDQALWAVLSLIPTNASLLTQYYLTPYVTDRLNVYPAWRPDIQFDYIFVDTTHYTYQTPPSTLIWIYNATTGEKMREILSTRDFSIVAAVDGIWLLRKASGMTVNLEKVISPDGHGLMAKFYNNSDFAGEPVFYSTFLELGPDANSVWSTNWGSSSPFPTINGDSFSAEFTGYLYVPMSGNYTFLSNGKGNSTLYLDDNMAMADLQRVITLNQSADLENKISNHMTIQLDKGFHKFKLMFSTHESTVYMQINWLPPWKETSEVLPGENLYLQP